MKQLYCDECQMPLATREERRQRICERCQFVREQTGNDEWWREVADLRDALQRNWRVRPLGSGGQGRNG